VKSQTSRTKTFGKAEKEDEGEDALGKPNFIISVREPAGITDGGCLPQKGGERREKGRREEKRSGSANRNQKRRDGNDQKAPALQTWPEGKRK